MEEEAVNALEKEGTLSFERCLNLESSSIKFLRLQPSSLFDFTRSQEAVFLKKKKKLQCQFGVRKSQNNVCIIRCFPSLQKPWVLCRGGCLGWRQALAKYRFLASIALPEVKLGPGLWPGLFCLKIPLSNLFCGLSDLNLFTFPSNVMVISGDEAAWNSHTP